MGPNLEGACCGSLGFESRVVAATGVAGKGMKGTGQECAHRVGRW